MQRAPTDSEAGMVTEMAIVDTFTKLIFGEEGFNPRELLIIQAFREAQPDVSRGNHPEMGEFLRNLGVREMISLVSRLREHMSGTAELITSHTGPSMSQAPRRTH